MKSFWDSFLLGFSALFVFFPFASNQFSDKENGIAKSWENVGIYLKKAMLNNEQAE